MSISTPSLYKQMNASANVSANPGVCVGIMSSSVATNSSITIYDDSSTGTTTKIVNTFTPAAGTFYPFRFKYSKGLNVVLANAPEITVFFDNDMGA